MLDEKGFDLWADGYDRSVQLSEESDEYPFAGYKDVLNAVYRAVHAQKQASVLDLGFGTGALTAKLYAEGYAVTGVDFSEKMCTLAQKKMPNARLIRADLTQGIPKEICGERFGTIVSTYAMHHLTDPQKETLWRGLLALLLPGGSLVIGDVAFETEAEQEACRARYEEMWDEDEIYIVAERFKPAFPGLRFQRVSHCAGVLTINNDCEIN